MRHLFVKHYNVLQMIIIVITVGLTAQFKNPLFLLLGFLMYIVPKGSALTIEEVVAAAMICDSDLHEVNKCPIKTLERAKEKEANYRRNAE